MFFYFPVNLEYFTGLKIYTGICCKKFKYAKWSLYLFHFINTAPIYIFFLLNHYIFTFEIIIRSVVNPCKCVHWTDHNWDWRFMVPPVAFWITTLCTTNKSIYTILGFQVTKQFLLWQHASLLETYVTLFLLLFYAIPYGMEKNQCYNCTLILCKPKINSIPTPKLDHSTAGIQQ